MTETLNKASSQAAGHFPYSDKVSLLKQLVYSGCGVGILKMSSCVASGTSFLRRGSEEFILWGTLCMLMFSATFPMQAQVRMSHLPSNPSLPNRGAEHPSFQLRDGEPLDLPFMDDFSYQGPFPNPDNWCDRTVFVNNGFPVGPPSIGVATFDGLDANGTPYGVSGAGDTLTSQPFNLGEYTASDNVYLSFFHQAKGFGEGPETGDSLILEFKTDADVWTNIQSWEGIGSGQPNGFVPAFSFHSFAIPAEYLYDGFQFRIRNKTSGSGLLDIWNVDYIRMTTDVIPSANFNDVAFTRPATTFLAHYTSMPWRQYEGFEEAESTADYGLSFFSLFPDVQEIQNRMVAITEVNSGVQVMNANYLTDAELPIPLGNVDPATHITALKTFDAGSYQEFLSEMADNFNNEDELTFVSRFSYDQSGQDPAFPAVFGNDVATVTTHFGNYFAYDDGAAESSVYAQGMGTEVAVKYTLNAPDSLRGVAMHIPHVNVDVSTQLFNIKVYLSLDSDPIHEANFLSPIYLDAVFVDSLQGFSTYAFKDELGFPKAIALPAGDFHIAWQQGSGNPEAIPVGMDLNSDKGADKNFYNSGGGFEPFPSTISGAIMFRPLMGDQPVQTTSNEPLAAGECFHIYPNPADDVLVLRTKSHKEFNGAVEIFDAMGACVSSSVFQESISVVDYAPGIYFVLLTDWETGIRYGERVVVY